MWETENQRGFTLIELIISMGVVMLLSAGIISLIGRGPQEFARDGRRQADILSAQSAIELFRNDNATYPPCTGAAASCDLANVPTLVSGGYMTTLPTDPSGGTRIYRYTPKNSSGNACAGTAVNRCVTYTICASGENTTTNNNASCGNLTCGGTNNCSFVLTNP